MESMTSDIKEGFGQQAVWVDVNRDNPVLKKQRMEDVHLKYMHVSKDLCITALWRNLSHCFWEINTTRCLSEVPVH